MALPKHSTIMIKLLSGDLPLDGVILSTWFPRMDFEDIFRREVHAAAMIDRIHHLLSQRHPVQKAEIESVLKFLFTCLYKHSIRRVGGTRESVTKSLLNLLEQGPAYGLPRARETFLILVSLACFTGSAYLAESLVQFWIMSDIHYGSEARKNDVTWHSALYQLRYNFPEVCHHKPIFARDHLRLYPPRPRSPRGRPARRPDTIWENERALSAPTAYLEMDFDLTPALCSIPEPAWEASVVLRDHSPLWDYSDDVGRLQRQQERMDKKLSEIDQKVDELLYRSD